MQEERSKTKGAAVGARADIDADQAAVFFQKLWKV